LSTLLLDASVWLAALDTDDRHHLAARSILERSADGKVVLAALDLTLYEVANVAVVRWRSSAAAAHLVELVCAACPDTLQRVDEALARQAAAIAADDDLTVYDAAYVAAARSNHWALVSGDIADLVRPGHALPPDRAYSTASRVAPLVS
jgi:predicted nucleic acid-binding protein